MPISPETTAELAAMRTKREGVAALEQPGWLKSQANIAQREAIYGGVGWMTGIIDPALHGLHRLVGERELFGLGPGVEKPDYSTAGAFRGTLERRLPADPAVAGRLFGKTTAVVSQMGGNIASLVLGGGLVKAGGKALGIAIGTRGAGLAAGAAQMGGLSMAEGSMDLARAREAGLDPSDIQMAKHYGAKFGLGLTDLIPAFRAMKLGSRAGRISWAAVSEAITEMPQEVFQNVGSELVSRYISHLKPAYRSGTEYSEIMNLVGTTIKEIGPATLIGAGLVGGAAGAYGQLTEARAPVDQSEKIEGLARASFGEEAKRRIKALGVPAAITPEEGVLKLPKAPKSVKDLAARLARAMPDPDDGARARTLVPVFVDMIAKNEGLSADEVARKFYVRKATKGEEAMVASPELEVMGRTINLPKLTSVFVRAFRAADIGTMIHELTHGYDYLFPERFKPIKDWALAEKPTEFPNEESLMEFVANSHMEYLRTGKAPAPGLKKVFKEFRDWLKKLWRDWRGDLSLVSSKEVKTFFDSLWRGEGGVAPAVSVLREAPPSPPSGVSEKIRRGEALVTYREGAEHGVAGTFYGTKVRGAAKKTLPLAGPGVRMLWMPEHEGTAAGAPLADFVEAGHATVSEDTQRQLAGKLAEDSTWVSDLVGAISLKEQGVDVMHFVSPDDASAVVSVDLRKHSLGELRTRLEGMLTTDPGGESIRVPGGLVPPSYVDETVPVPRWHSKLETSLGEYFSKNFIGKPIPTEQLKGIINKIGIKGDELEATGVKELLATEESVTWSKVQEVLRLNKVELIEGPDRPRIDVHRGGGVDFPTTVYTAMPTRDNPMPLAAIYHPTKADPTFRVFREVGEGKGMLVGEYSAEEEATVAAEQVVDVALANYTRWDDPRYNFPGGSDYFEHVPRLAADVVHPRAFVKPEHWSVPNPLFHIRGDMRTGADGVVEMFCQDLQSDWWRTLEDMGRIATPEKKTKLREQTTERLKSMKTRLAEVSGELDALGVLEHPEAPITPRSLPFVQERSLLSDEIRDAERTQYFLSHDMESALARTKVLLDEAGVEDLASAARKLTLEERKELSRLNAYINIPDFPFKHTWHDLAFKAAVKLAIEKGATRLTWTSGAIQEKLWGVKDTRLGRLYDTIFPSRAKHLFGKYGVKPREYAYPVNFKDEHRHWPVHGFDITPALVAHKESGPESLWERRKKLEGLDRRDKMERNWWQKLGDTLDMAARWIRVDMPTVGWAFKVAPSIRERWHDTVAQMMRPIRANLSLGEWRALDQLAPLIFEDEAAWAAMSQAERSELSTSRQRYRAFMKQILKTYQKLGVMEFGGLIENAKVEINELITKAEERGDSEKAANYRVSLKQLANLRYVHIPYTAWFLDKLRADPARMAEKLRIVAQIKRTRGRETGLPITIRDLILHKVIDPSELSLTQIMASYARRVGKDMASLNILEAAIKDKAAIRIEEHTRRGRPKGKAPIGFTWAGEIAPLFKNYWVRNALNDHLYEAYTFKSQPHAFTRFMSGVKGFQFANPFFLPMYDFFQLMMDNTLRAHKIPGAAYKALKQMGNRTKEFYEAEDGGISSKPIANPFASVQEMVERAGLSYGEKFGHFVQEMISLNPKRMLKGYYNIAWNGAWAMDRFIRQTHYNILRDQGIPRRQAAQQTALFHGDYASVPAETRRFLNQFLFTPTFKIVQTKLWIQMLTETANVARHPFDNKRTLVQKNYARALVQVLGLIALTDLAMRALDFEPDEYGRRWAREVETDEGTREIALTMSNPLNMHLKYIYRLIEAADPSVDNSMLKFLQANKWEIHPVWRIGWEVVENKGGGGVQIANPLDHPLRQGLDKLRYALTEGTRVFAPFEETAQDRKTERMRQREFGTLLAGIMRPFTFSYTRHTKDMRCYFAIKRLVGAARGQAARGTLTPERIEVLHRRVDELAAEAEQIQKARAEKRGRGR